MSDIVWGNMHCAEECFTVQELTPAGEIFSILYSFYSTPDWARLPPELGGEIVQVQANTWKPCPSKYCRHQSVLHLLLKSEQTDSETSTLCVAKCPDHGWQFYQQVYLDE